jgi:purine-nucleoside phosphorylase
MVLVNQTHIITPTANPLDALVEGSRHKAYLVANLAFNDSPEASAEQYHLTIAQVYSAMAFYRDNEEAINLSLQTERELGKEMGAQDLDTLFAEIRARATKKD